MVRGKGRGREKYREKGDIRREDKGRERVKTK